VVAGQTDLGANRRYSQSAHDVLSKHTGQAARREVRKPCDAAHTVHSRSVDRVLKSRAPESQGVVTQDPCELGRGTVRTGALGNRLPMM